MDTILIVDDEKSILDLLTMVFKKDGYRVVTNPGTAKAFELLASEDVDLVISDIKMPQLDGMAFLKAVKKQRPDVPVIVITAFGSVKQAVEALKEGALDYVTKPFDIEELKILVDQTRGGSITLAPTLTSGAVPATSTINFPSGDIRASGITVPLGPGGKLDAMYRAASPSNAERTDIVFDVTGYFAKDPATGPYHASATVVIASDESYSDAIVAGSVAARLGVPFLLVTHNALPAATAAAAMALLSSLLSARIRAVISRRSSSSIRMLLCPNCQAR